MLPRPPQQVETRPYTATPPSCDIGPVVPSEFRVMERPTRVTRVNWEAVARAQIHPLKLRIIELYAAGDNLTPVDVQKQLDEPTLGTVSYHVRALVTAGLIELVRTEQRRGALAHFYRATPNLLARRPQ